LIGGEIVRNPNFILKALRTKHQYTQEYVAKYLNISETTYNRKENGFSEFTIAEAEQLSILFETPPTEIFFNQGVTKCITNI
jgi:Predicted transcriptional regulators